VKDGKGRFLGFKRPDHPPQIFDSPSTEETLRISVSARSQYPALEEFLSACPREPHLSVAALVPIPWVAFKRSQEVADYLRRFAGVLSGEPSTVIVYPDDWNELAVLIQTPQQSIWYHWDTTA
jgi:hypothetical protein